jgi:hypothetical protein
MQFLDFKIFEIEIWFAHALDPQWLRYLIPLKKICQVIPVLNPLF